MKRLLLALPLLFFTGNADSVLQYKNYHTDLLEEAREKDICRVESNELAEAIENLELYKKGKLKLQISSSNKEQNGLRMLKKAIQDAADDLESCMNERV